MGSRPSLSTGPIPGPVMDVLRAIPPSRQSRWTRCARPSPRGARPRTCPGHRPSTGARTRPRSRPPCWPRSPDLRAGKQPIDPDPSLDLVSGFLYQLKGERPDPATARALDAYFIVGAEHGFNASTFTARVVTSTRSDIASAVAAAIGTMKGPLHGGAPSEVVDQLAQVKSTDDAEQLGARDARQGRSADGLRPPRLPRV